MAEDAGDVTFGGLGEFRSEFLFLAFEFEETDFDEFVIVERAIGGADDGVGKAVFPDVDDGLEMMGERAELFSL